MAPPEPPAPPPEDHRAAANATLSPSAASPSHEFSFTTPPRPSPAAAAARARRPIADIDLSPAGDIFFHGHLLPLDPVAAAATATVTTAQNSKEKQLASKHKPPPWKPSKENQTAAGDEREEKKASRRRGIDLVSWLRKYTSMVEQLFSPRRRAADDLRRRPHSFSGRANPRDTAKRRRKGQLSAPASLRTSPANSARMLLSPSVYASPAEGSSMEELQSAIEAAIAHCKSSISAASVSKKNDKL